MGIDIKSFKNEDTYEEILNYNLDIIKDLEKDELINKFILFLSKTTNLDYDIILKDLQRFIMMRTEYYYDSLHVSIVRSVIIDFMKIIYRSFMWNFFKKLEKVDIIIDNWVKDSLNQFYGKSLINKLVKKYLCRIINISSFCNIRPWFLFKYLSNIIKSYFYVMKINYCYKINLSNYVRQFYFEFLSGLTLGNIKILITGNDNGFPVIKAKTMNAVVIAMQNGIRPYVSDSTFKYIDYYIALGTDRANNIRYNLGCKFENVYSFGSIRLHNFLENNKKTITDKYDILFIDWDDLSITGKAFYSKESEIKLIKLLNLFSTNSDYKIIAHYRFKRDLEYLKKHDLMSDDIEYFCRDDVSAYELILKSKLIISCGSTLNLEALALNRKMGLINLSKNDSLYIYYGDSNMELRENNLEAFKLFINKMFNKNIESKKYILQNPNYTKNIISIVDNILKQ